MSTLKFMVEIEPAPGTRLLCTQDQLGEGLITLMRSLLTVWTSGEKANVTVTTLPSKAVAVDPDALLALQEAVSRAGLKP